MMRNSMILLGAAAMSLMLGGCGKSTAGNAGSADSAKQAINADAAKWNKDFKAKDTEALSGHYADDAFLVAPGVTGADGSTAIRQVYATASTDPAFEVHFTVDKTDAASGGDMGYMSKGYIFIVGRAKDMIIINGRNHWPQDIEWAVEQLPGFKSGDIAAFAITGPSGEETPAVLVHCRVSDNAERGRLRDEIRERVRAITGITPVVELVPPRTLPRTSSGKLSRTKARNLYLSGEIQPYDIAA